MIDETLFGGFPSAELKQIFIMELAKRAQLYRRYRCGFDINVTRRSF